MDIKKNNLLEIETEIFNELENIDDIFDDIKLNRETYPEEFLLHLIMIRTQLKSIKNDMDDYRINIDNYCNNNLETVKKYNDVSLSELDLFKIFVHKKWIVFKNCDTETRKEMNDFIST
tara:strand:+ start:286 stop:642 length:357 start_codon:yes stop_codon:yes gene_type:complete